MRKLALVVVMSMALFGATAVFAADHGMKGDNAEGARQCALQAESIQEKISRLQTEINKGTKVYSTKELKRLENKLKEANKILEDLTRN